MSAEEHLQGGRLAEALAALQNSIRNHPTDPRLRIFLFQLQCVLGNWEKAVTQLKVLADLNAETFLLSQLFGPVIQCELFRSEVFAGKRTPLILGEPMEWVGLLVQANTLVAQGQFLAAQELRDRAFDAAPATAGKINDQPFAWIADADSRLGPLLEVILEGKYFWIPFCRIKQVHLESPADLRDLVWAPAQFVWDNGGEASGHIPTRYALTEVSEDSSLRLARRTEWKEPSHGFFLGLGQRILSTDDADHPLLECRKIDLNAT